MFANEHGSFRALGENLCSPDNKETTWSLKEKNNRIHILSSLPGINFEAQGGKKRNHWKVDPKIQGPVTQEET